MNENDFSKRRSRMEFNAWVEEWQTRMATLDGISDVLIRDRLNKRMYEEANPIYHYLRRVYGDGDVDIELPGDSGADDGRILSKDGKVLERLQVSVAVEFNDWITRKKLANKGLDVADQFARRETLDDYRRTVNKIISKKLQLSYDKETTLLIPLSSNMVLELQERFDAIVDKLDPIPHGHRFSRIILMEEAGFFWRDISGR